MTISIAKDDENLQSLIGREIPSEITPNVHYRPEQMLGRGGGAIAFLSQRVSKEGKAPVVIKVLRPAFVKKLGETAYLLIRKEAVALGRLNERTPTTPFVVRLVDTGVVQVERAGTRFDLPWVAIEYVHGGTLGTTLAQRVRRSLRDTGYAFDPGRAGQAVDCIGQGLAAVHEVGVIHRDLTPNNVLCSGRGHEEVFKIADFGVARPSGVQGTLSGALVGTPGFAAPELATGDNLTVAADVFSFASVIFYLLTGEPMFNSMVEIMRSVETGRRRSLLEMPGLHPDLRKNEKACRSIDLVLGWGAAVKPDARLSEALAVSSMILPHLVSQQKIRERSFISSFPRPADARVAEPKEWRWNVLYRPGSSLVIRSVAWDGHGRAIAATSDGLSFWNGTAWKVATTEGLRLAGGVRFVQRVGAGRWILGGDDAQIAIYTTGGAVDLIAGPRDAQRVDAFEGDLEDISVLVTSDATDTVCLNTYAGKRWLKPLALPGVASIATIARFDDNRWIVAGRRKQGGAYAALYGALDWDLDEVPGAAVNAFLACVTRRRKGIGHVVGTQGAMLTVDGDSRQFERVPDGPALSAIALDPYARPWVASSGKILIRDEVAGWQVAWKDDSVQVPIVSLFLDAGLCIAMTADGGIIEGRLLGGRSDSTSNGTPPSPTP